MTWQLFTITSYAAAFFSLGLGLYGLVSPKGALDLIGLQTVPGLSHSISEVRATYGGVFIGVSLYPLLSGEPHAFLALAAAWTLAGICRLASTVFDGATTRFNVTSVVIELCMGVLIALPHLSAL
ncbi:MAG: DUF4345 family protein [Alphaproteobacteria bacterium]|nr:DUF4345 family protein [Alphaproteobacteria bacterium]